ncbi:MAG: hypothetical protein Q4G34_01435 [Micrococcus sp.]|nr:hypothetical protein [Micrococcus sp.]
MMASNSTPAEYSKRERQHRHQTNIDIVLVGSDSLETVMVTHSTYFTRSEQSTLRELLRLDELTAPRS